MRIRRIIRQLFLLSGLLLPLATAPAQDSSATASQNRYDGLLYDDNTLIDPSIPDQWNRFSEYTHAVFPWLLALADSGYVTFPDVHLLSIEPNDSIDTGLALIDINDENRCVKIRSDKRIHAHWHARRHGRFRYQVLVEPGPQTLVVYYKPSVPMPIQVNIPAGHVLTLDQESSGVFPDGDARRGSPLSVSDCYAWEPRIVDRKNVRAIPWHHWPGLDTWPPDAYETGISGDAVVRFDYLPHRDPMNVTLVREDSPGWGFADSAIAAVKRTEYEFLDKSYSYAPYRVWMTARYPRQSLPWENIVRGLQYNRQLVLASIDYPDSLRHLQDDNPQMETRFGRIPDFWLYLESDQKDLNVFCPDSRVTFYPVTDTSVVLHFGYDATDLRLRAPNGLSFHHFVGGQQGRAVRAYRIMSSFSPAIDTMSAENTLAGRFVRDHLSWMGVPLFEFPDDSTGKGIAIFNPKPVVDDHWHEIELLRQARIYSGNTTSQRVHGYAELDLVIEHDLATVEPGDSVFIRIKQNHTHEVDPPESGFEDVAEYYMSRLHWFFDPTLVDVWRSMPTELRPVSPDTIRHKVKIPMFGDISQPIRNPHSNKHSDNSEGD